MEVAQSQAKDGRSVRTGAWGRSLTVAALIFASLWVGCGVPGPPLPPLLEIPEPVQDLSAAQVGSRIHLVWSPPRLTTEGTRVQRLERLEVHAVFLEGGTSLESFPEQARLVATLQAASPQPEQMVYELPLGEDRIGRTAFFAVKARNDKGRDGGFSNIASIQIVDLPGPPAQLEATLAEEAVRLRWRAAARSVFGGVVPSPDGYKIFRSDADSPEGVPEGMKEIGSTDAPQFEDTSFEFGRTYRYFVRAFRRTEKSVAASPPSEPVEVRAQDRFPPAVPQNLRALAVPGAIEMSWSPNPEADLAGYNVHRSEGGPLQKLNRDLLSIPLFRDRAVTPGTHYRYQVRAVDQNGNESPPSEEVSVIAE